MRPLFQADADLNTQIVFGLRRRQPAIDFQTAQGGDVIGEHDAEVLAIAALSGRILVSHDRKTMPGHFAQFIKRQASPGVILVRQRLDIGAAIDDLVLIWSVTEAEEWRNRLGFLPV
jgi:Domain of unknown function (DUF5615)